MLDWLGGARLEVVERMPWSSNATFLAALVDGETEALVVYKPRQGERPLWDFPPGTLCDRELAAFEVSEAADWAIVPPTVVRDGPLGPGMVQLFVDHDPEEHFLELRDEHADRFREFAVFDAAINNADRKSGHCVKDARGHIWGIDHGVSFHAEHKLRTVIWDYAGEPFSPELADALCRLARGLDGPVGDRLAALLSPREADATRDRLRRLVDGGSFPLPRGDYPYPWPLV